MKFEHSEKFFSRVKKDSSSMLKVSKNSASLMWAEALGQLIVLVPEDTENKASLKP